ncbi:MAG: hypothetical protein IJT32_02750 [Lachnospiraceae bacterium]|nr:hypothetical protein [Lachnospiraceae bacterium]
MADRRLLICDTDSAYVTALTAFLMHALKGFSITTYTRLESFAGDTGSYHVSLLGEAFLEEALKPEESARFGTVLYLCADVGNANGDGYPSVYKFQHMDAFVKAILSYAGMPSSNKGPVRCRTKRWVGIHSPVHHELQLPFALAYAKHAARQDKVLFLDMETNSILEELIDCANSKSLIDALYLSEEAAGADIAALADYYEGMSYFAPMRNFGEAAGITDGQWERLFAAADRTDYDTVVVLFDDGLQCASALIARLSELILVDKPGDYYRKSKTKIQRHLSAMTDGPRMREISLAMSANNLTDGTYRFEQLLHGNLGRFVESEFA